MATDAQLSLPVLGEIPNHWAVVEFGSILDGGTRNGIYKSKEFHGRGDKIVNMGELFAYPRLFSVPMKRVELSEKEQENFRLQVGDLLFARRSLVAEGAGKCSIVCDIQEPTTFESSIIRARPHTQVVDSLYLYYLFRSSYGAYALDTIRRQVAVSGITGTDLVKLKIPLPPLDEQKAIAHILGTLDDKIELNQQMNHTLESIARALFKSWFIDFDPVRAKMHGRQPAGMDAETAALFPNEFEDSPIGEIPKGWNVLPIKDLVAQVFDGPHATPPPSETGAVYLGIKNFTGTALDLSDSRKISEEDWEKWTKRVIPQAGDIVFTYEATLGFFALIPQWLRCCLGRRIALVRPKFDQQDNFFLFHTFIGQPFQQFLVAHTNHGSTVDRILLTEFPSYKILYPPKALIFEFNELACTLWGKIHINQKQNQDLALIRDALLPELLSGEIRVKDTEKIMEPIV